ncbi:MAG TPA: acetylglutamate kinase [Terriglobales bacterium]|jgi:acetylglutamate kinase|nr:acetylglutamate kinase [Terriglobales bacterium]
MKLVIKIGGRALENKDLTKQFAHAIAGMARQGHKIVVVHGGGVALSRTLHELGRETQFIDGLRITDPQTRDVALMVLAGQMNKQLVAAIGRAGLPAVGLCGGDLKLFRAAKRRGQHDLGFVGDICSVDSQWFETIWEHGAVPVISSIALGMDGEYYNVNADQAASACAVAWKANALVFLTDVPGVKGADGAVIRWLDVESIGGMVQQTTVSGGMVPKLEACTQALRRGVHRVRILPATSVEVLPGFFTHRIECGTEVVIH